MALSLKLPLELSHRSVTESDRDFVFRMYELTGEAAGVHISPDHNVEIFAMGQGIERRTPGSFTAFFDSTTPVGIIQLADKADVLACLSARSGIDADADAPELYKAAAAREDFVYADMICVAPEYRGRGVFRQMLAYAAGFTREQGKRVLLLSVTEYNKNAVAAYEACGFVKDGPRIKVKTAGWAMRYDAA